MYALLNKAQPKVMRILENSKQENRLSHAYLFTGPEGTHKLEMAQYFAMMLYCKEERPCGHCANCLAILENRHLNVFRITPQGQSIKKEQIMALQQEFSKTSLVDGPRIYIIEDADLMSTGAANSLLKFIEEPTNEYTYGILLTQHQDNMLQTIISRSVVISFAAPSKSLLKEEFLAIGIETLEAEALTCLTNSQAGAAELVEKESFTLVFDTFKKFITQLANKNPLGLFYRANYECLGNRVMLGEFLILIENFYRDIYEYLISKKLLTFFSLAETIEQIALTYTADDIIKYLNLILEIDKKIGYNVNVSLYVNQLLITLRGGKI